MKRLLTGWLASVGLALSLASFSASAQQIGDDYTVISPALPTEVPDKIEVVEFFSYACPHCNVLNPGLTQWAARQPADVTLRKVAVGFNSPFYQLTAKLYYALDAIGEEKRLNDVIFKAIHSQGVKLVDEKSVTAWVVAQGVDRKKFSEAFNSFGVRSQLTRSDKLVESAKLPGVPALVVDGRYLVGGPNIKSFTELLAVTDKLVDKARAERSLAKK